MDDNATLSAVDLLDLTQVAAAMGARLVVMPVAQADDDGKHDTLRLAADVYPNQPNVKRYQVELSSAIFDDPRWDVSTAGPFVLAIRK